MDFLICFLYPASANAFDSLGEIYADHGDTGLAIKNYGPLKLNPQNNNEEQQIKNLNQTSKASHNNFSTSRKATSLLSLKKDE